MSQNVEALTSLYREWARGNFVDNGIFAPEIRFEPLPERAVVRGTAGISAYMAEFLRQWSDYRVEAQEFLDRGDSVVVGERQYGTGKSTGIETAQTVYAVWTFQRGRVVQVRWEQDRAKALNTLGLVEE